MIQHGADKYFNRETLFVLKVSVAFLIDYSFFLPFLCIFCSLISTIELTAIFIAVLLRKLFNAGHVFSLVVNPVGQNEVLWTRPGFILQ